MPQDQWSDTRERQYEHVKASYEEHGEIGTRRTKPS
jgi:hypothetical protein